MTDIEKELVANGYKRSTCSYGMAFKGTEILYQKRITDNHGTRYFISCWYYSKCSITPETIQFEVQFTLKDGESMDVTSFYKCVYKSEILFENIWTKLECGYRD